MPGSGEVGGMNPKDDLLHTLRTEAVEDFLKAVYQLERQHSPVATNMIAARLGIRPPSVTEMARKLAAHGLLEYEKYKGLRLTEAGRRIALEVIRHHRLIEMYLTEALGYTWDEVHDEADRLEHVISEQFEARIAAAMGHPNHDPHGDPIPAPDGSLPLPAQGLATLQEATFDQLCLVHRITDQSPETLRYLADRGLVPGAQIMVTGHESPTGPIHVLVEDTASVVDRTIASHVLVKPVARRTTR